MLDSRVAGCNSSVTPASAPDLPALCHPCGWGRLDSPVPRSRGQVSRPGRIESVTEHRCVYFTYHMSVIGFYQETRRFIQGRRRRGGGRVGPDPPTFGNRVGRPSHFSGYSKLK